MCDKKKRLTLFLISSKNIFLFLNLKFCLVYAYILKKKQECIYKNTTNIHVFRRDISSVTLSFSYDSVKSKKKQTNTVLERVLKTGNFQLFDFLHFLLFFINKKCFIVFLNTVVKVMREPNPDVSLQTSLTPCFHK